MVPIVIQKHPGAILDISVSYVNELAMGETIASATAAVVGSGTITVDPTPDVVTPIVTVRVSDGTDGITDSFVILATTSTGEILDATIYIQVSIGATVPLSYSTPDNLAARIGPKIYAQLTSETGTDPDDSVGQGVLDAAAAEINIRIGNRYTVPVTAPAATVARLAGLEEQIALWFLWVRRGIGDQESAASAAKVGYDAAMALLNAIAKGDIDLTGVLLRPVPTGATGVGWKSNTPVYTNENFRMF